MTLWTLLACGSQDPGPATVPDPVATQLVVDALCKLADGGKHDCTSDAATVTLDGTHALGVAVFLDHTEETLGQFTFDGRAVITPTGGSPVTTRFQHYGWGQDEAFEKGVHYWAVLSGAAIVDWVLQDATRPALMALEGRQPPVVTHRGTVGEFTALRGWTFLQGVKVELPHDAILAAVAPQVSGLSSEDPHTVEIRIASEMGEQVYTCHLDGVASEDLCTAAKTAPWPAGIGWELRQVYLLAPTFPNAPPPVEAPAEGD